MSARPALLAVVDYTIGDEKLHGREPRPAPTAQDTSDCHLVDIGMTCTQAAVQQRNTAEADEAAGVAGCAVPAQA